MKNHDKSSTSADLPEFAITGGKPVNQSVPVKRKQMHTFKPKAKRPALVAEREEAFQRVSISYSLFMAPCMTYHAVYTSSNGIPMIAKLCWNALFARVKSIRDVISLEHLQYVIAIAWYARLVRVNNEVGTKTCIVGSSNLRKVSRGIRLPIFIAKYIEALGVYKMQNGASIIPYVNEYDQMIELGSDWYYDPREPLEQASRTVPSVPWAIDPEWIAQYITVSTPKLIRSGIELVPISEETTGTPELVIGLGDETTDSEGVRPKAPERQTEAVASLGAAYHFRRYVDMDNWPFGDNRILYPLFEGEAVNPNITVAQIISASLTSAQ